MSNDPAPRPEPVPLPPSAPTLIDMARASGIISPEQARQLAMLAQRAPVSEGAETAIEVLAPSGIAHIQGADTVAEHPSTHSIRRASDVLRLSAVFAPQTAQKLTDMPDVPEEVRVAWSLPNNRFGKYVLVTRLGAGAMGDVWRAWQSDLGRWVALKFLKGDNPEEVARFVQEARTAAKLTHPNIVTTFEAGESGGIRFIAMEYLEGADLGRGTLELRRAVEAIRDAARAVQYAHDQGIIHRDLKPSNLFMTGTGRLCVTDFGLAKSVKAPSGLSQTGAIVGTPYYMSPEQADGKTELDARSDVWALGATLYHLVTGRPPFTGSTWVEILRGVLQEDPIPPRQLNHHVSREVETIILKSLEKDPARRYPSASALAKDFDRWLKGEPIHARPASLLYKLWLRVRKHKAATAALSALVGTLSTIGSIYYVTPGTLNLNVAPPGARVTIGERSWTVGKEPLPVRLPAGAYEVKAELADHETEERDVIVERGRTKDLTLGLAHHQGRLEAESQPLGSEVEVDGVAYGSRLRNLALDTGRHTLRAWCSGHFERTAEIEVKRGEVARAFLWLEPAVEWVKLSSGIPSGGGITVGIPDLDGDGVRELMHMESTSLVIRRPQDGRELRRIAAAGSVSFVHRIVDLGAGPVLLIASEETTGLVLTCIDPRREGDAGVLWQWIETPPRAYTHPLSGGLLVLDDRNGDGVKEIALASRDPGVWIIDGRTGQARSTWATPVFPGVIGGVGPRDPGKLLFAGAKLRPDEEPSAPSGPMTAGCLRLSDGGLDWSLELGKVVNATPIDLDGDGAVELLWRSPTALGVLEAKTGTLRWSCPLAADTIVGDLGCTDVDGDGAPDVLLLGKDGAVTAVAGKDGRLLWKRAWNSIGLGSGAEGIARLPGGELLVIREDALQAVAPGDGTVRWTTPGVFHGVRVLDWDGDGKKEILCGAQGVGIVCLDLAGRRLWTMPLGQDVTPVTMVPDSDGDGLDEIAIHAGATLVGVMHGPRKLWARRAAGPLLASPVAIDVDGDGRPEVISLGPWGAERGLVCLDGKSGLIRWARSELFAPNRGPGFGDLDGDGLPDLVMPGWRTRDPARRLFVYRGKDGEVAHEWPFEAAEVYAAPAMADLNGDGVPDPVYQRWGAQDLAATDGRTGKLLWQCATGAPAMGAAAAADLDGDGKPDAVAPFMNGHVYAVRGVDGKPLWTADIDPEGSRAPATLADVNDDGTPDALVVSMRGTLWALDGKTGKALWSIPGGSEALGRPAVVRRPGSATLVVAPRGVAGVAAFDVAAQALVWEALAGRHVLASPVVADLDGDRRLEVVCATWDGELVVLDLDTGRRLWGIEVGEREIEADPVVADLDGDGVLDILVADHGGNLQAISGRATISARRK